MAVEIHVVVISPQLVSPSGTVVRRNSPTTTIGDTLNASTEHRVLEDSSNPNTDSFPDVATYLSREASDGFELVELNQTNIITKRVGANDFYVTSTAAASDPDVTVRDLFLGTDTATKGKVLSFTDSSSGVSFVSHGVEISNDGADSLFIAFRLLDGGKWALGGTILAGETYLFMDRRETQMLVAKGGAGDVAFRLWAW